MRRRAIAIAILLVGGLGVWFWLQWLEHDVSLQPFSLIEENLYVGGWVERPPKGTKAVVNLCQFEDRYPVEIYRADPIDGSDAPGIDWLRQVVDFIDAQRKAGKPTYIHCFAGMNRSGMVVTAYLMFEHGWTRDEALAFAQSKRPQIQPNLVLMRFLAEWERVLKEPK